MITRKAEILVALGKAGSITAAEEGLLDMIHPLAEAAVLDYMQHDIKIVQHVEYLPIGTADSRESTLDDIDFRAGSAVFTFGGRGVDGLQLKHTPVWLTGLEVKEDVGANAAQTASSFGSETVLTLGSDYFLDVDDPAETDLTGASVAVTALSRTGILHRIGAWPTEPRSVKVTYYGGLGVNQLARGAGAAVKLAIVRTVCQMYWAMKSNQTSGGSGPKQSETIGKYSYSRGGTSVASLSAGLVIPADAKMLLQPHRNYGRLYGVG